MNQLEQINRELSGKEFPAKTAFGHFNYLTPGPSHTYHSTTIEKLAANLKKAADSLEGVKPLIEALRIEGEALQVLDEAKARENPSA